MYNLIFYPILEKINIVTELVTKLIFTLFYSCFLVPW